MEYATQILIYAWVGWAVLMLPTLFVLWVTSVGLVCLSNRIYRTLANIYKQECIAHYFNKMEKEGTHAFKK
jgi:hypothetical protein